MIDVTADTVAAARGYELNPVYSGSPDAAIIAAIIGAQPKS